MEYREGRKGKRDRKGGKVKEEQKIVYRKSETNFKKINTFPPYFTVLHPSVVIVTKPRIQK